MKKLLTLLGVMLAGTSIAQTTINNPGFENWSTITSLDSLEDWQSSSMEAAYQGQGIDNSYSVGNAQAGASAIHLETVVFYDIINGVTDTSFGYAIIGNPANSGGDTPPYVYTDTIDNVSGWYKCDVPVGDTAYALMECYSAGASYASGAVQFYGTQNTWTQFNMAVVDWDLDEPDSIFFGFASSDPFNTGVATDGSWLEIDNVVFEFNSGSPTPTQPPNASFENFYIETIEIADDWWSLDPYLSASVGSEYAIQSTDAASGSYSIEITTTTFNVFADVPSIVTNGWYDYGNDEFHGGNAYIAQPDSIIGQYKYSTLSTDTAWFWLEMWNSGTGVLVDTTFALLPAAAWTQFSIDLGLMEAPDSMLIVLYSGEQLGSELLIDDLDFIGGDLSYGENPNSIEWGVYPNPSSTEVTIEYTEADQVEILDVSGRIIYREGTEGKVKSLISTSEWSEGVYFIRIRNNGKSASKKLIIRH